jgi:uncharacterized membrane protein
MTVEDISVRPSLRALAKVVTAARAEPDPAARAARVEPDRAGRAEPGCAGRARAQRGVAGLRRPAADQPGTSVIHAYLRSHTGAMYCIDYPNSPHTEANGLNDRGEVTGFYTLDGQVHGYLRGANGWYTTFDVPDAAESTTEPLGINNEGLVVGGFLDPDGVGHGFIRDQWGRIGTLDVPGSTSTLATGVNDRGEVVGAFQSPDGVIHGFHRDARGRFSTIDVPGSQLTIASRANGKGQIIGVFSQTCAEFPTPPGQTHGFVLDARGYSLFDVPGGTDPAPNGITDAGLIIGGYTNQDGVIGVFELDGDRFRSFTVPVAASLCPAYDINDRGDVIGVYDTDDLRTGATGSPHS